MSADTRLLMYACWLNSLGNIVLAVWIGATR
jgi:hypothetical protein